MSLLQYTEYKDMICVVADSDFLGYFCGYIGVPHDHPLYGKDYQDVDQDVIVHGGLTYSENEMPGINLTSNDYWYFGFDCAHSGDICSMSDDFDNISCISKIHVWTIQKVMRECKYLADQFAEFRKDKVPSTLAIRNMANDIECQLTDMAEAADYKGKNAGNEQEKCMWYKLGFVLDQVLDMCFVANTLLDRLI